MEIKRGDVFYADLGPFEGSEQGGTRPVVIIQNDVGNLHSPTVICAAISTRKKNRRLPTHVFIDAARHTLMRDSAILLEQIRTIDKTRLLNKLGRLSSQEMTRVDRSLRISLGLEYGKYSVQKLQR